MGDCRRSSSYEVPDGCHPNYWISGKDGICIHNSHNETKCNEMGKMKQAKHPLAEVFGHLVTDQSASANRYRSRRLCPFNNKVPNCTKDMAKNPLGVCSVMHVGTPASLRAQSGFERIGSAVDDAASFPLPEDATWSSLTEA